MSKRDGSMAIMKCLFELVRLLGKYGVPARLAAAFPGLGAALAVLQGIVNIALGLDDLPLVIDAASPNGPEDLTGGSVEGPW